MTSTSKSNSTARRTSAKQSTQPDETSIQGEGNYEADRRYREKARDFAGSEAAAKAIRRSRDERSEEQKADDAEARKAGLKKARH